MIKNQYLEKVCLICKKVFNNDKKDRGYFYSKKVFNKRKFCSISCGAKNSRLEQYKDTNKYIKNGKICKLFISNKVYTVFDSEDFYKIKKYKWKPHAEGYICSDFMINGKRNHLMLHRLIMNLYSKSKLFVDHINGIKTDNRKSNLRIVTPQQNTLNSKINKNNKSGTRGVWWSEHQKRWITQISFKKKRFHLGTFKNKKDAIKKYKTEAKKLFGEYYTERKK